MELNMELVNMKDIETTSIIVHLMGSNKDRNKYENIGGLFDEISMGK